MNVRLYVRIFVRAYVVGMYSKYACMYTCACAWSDDTSRTKQSAQHTTVAVCCSALHCAAVRCSPLQCVAASCSELQCNTLPTHRGLQKNTERIPAYINIFCRDIVKIYSDSRRASVHELVSLIHTWFMGIFSLKYASLYARAQLDQGIGWRLTQSW